MNRVQDSENSEHISLTAQMATIPRSQNHLAELLGISKSAASKQVARGMLTHSLEAAKAWRKEHIDPSRMKGQRMDSFRIPGQPLQRVPRLVVLIDRASELMNMAYNELEGGRSMQHLIPDLRRALAAVPQEHRDRVGLPMSVMDVLVAHVTSCLPAKADNPMGDDGEPIWIDGSTMTDAEAQSVGEDWYRIAAGEILLDADSIARVKLAFQGAGSETP